MTRAAFWVLCALAGLGAFMLTAAAVYGGLAVSSGDLAHVVVTHPTAATCVDDGFTRRCR